MYATTDETTGRAPGEAASPRAAAAPRWLRTTRRWLWIAGLLLLIVAAVGALRGYLLADRDLRAFERARQSQSTPASQRLEPLPPPNTTDWSERRIQAYRDSVAEPAIPLAVLRIPSLDLTAPVHAGTDELTLNRGLGWIGGTSRPGGSGNVGIAGHRDGFFRKLRRIEVGDVVEILTLDAVHRYRVEKRWVVSPSDVEVLASNDRAEITLVTCFPFYYVGSAPERFIVRGRYLGSQQDQG